MLDDLKVKLQYILPKHLLSRLVGKLAAARLGWLTTAFINLFIKRYNVNMAESKISDARGFDTFNAFFTRELQDGVRPIDDAPLHLIYPVDGAISQLGDIDNDRIFQAKGHDYTATALLGGKPELASLFAGGKFSTIYLSPRDYHRIHMPCDGQLTDMLYVPGELFSVNPLTTENVPGLFARNERVVTLFDTEFGKMAMVLVGATIVASIETVWSGTVTPPTGKNVNHWQYPVTGLNAISLKKGEEMGRFKLGSTVVLLFERDMLEFVDANPADATRLGEWFAKLTPRS